MAILSIAEKKPRLLHGLDEARSRRLQRLDQAFDDSHDRTVFGHLAVIPNSLLFKFVQMMAHDFRHHLSALYASSEFLSMQCRDPLEGSDLLTDIRLAMDCMADQLESLLLFARTGHVFCPRPQSLTAVIEKTIQMVLPHADLYSVAIRSQLQSKIHGCVDEQRIGSAVFNLILNACQAAASRVPPGDREVIVALHDDGKDVFLRVTDNGPGVPPEMQNNLFRHFMWTGKNREMGLGLAIAKCVGQEHGGDVYLEMSSPGRTVFVLKIPKEHRHGMSDGRWTQFEAARRDKTQHC